MLLQQGKRWMLEPSVDNGAIRAVQCRPKPHLLGSLTVRYNVDRRTAPETRTVRLAGLYHGRSGEGARFVLFVALLGITALCGGSSWPNAWPLLILRPAAVLLAAVMLILPKPLDGGTLRAPALLLLALTLTVALQLVPLPPSLWAALPGHAPFLEGAAAAGMPQPWRPISLSMDMTLNSLVALVVPGAILLGGAALRPDQRAASAGLLMGVAVLSALLGLFQVTLGPSFYLYALRSVARPTGLFVNINHQAAALASTIPVAAAWAVAHQRCTPLRGIVAAATIALLLATVLSSGSRSGLLLAVLATLSVPLIIGDRIRLARQSRRLAFAGMAAAVVVLVTVMWLAGRLGGLTRLVGSGADQRVTYLPITLKLLRDYSPFGSGFGTFNAVFRHAEPDAVLKLTYFNHAHNDLLELAITGGVAAVAVAAGYVAWLAWRGASLFRAEQGAPGTPLARAGLFTAVLLLLASLTDYPLRAPLVAAMLALASLWVAERRIPA